MIVRLRLELVEAAKIAQHCPGDVFGHLHCHAGVVQAHHRHLRRQRLAELQNRIDPGTEIKNRFQSIATAQHRPRRLPDHRVIGRRIVAVRPDPHIGQRQYLVKFSQPLVVDGAIGVKKDLHGFPVMPF